MEDQILRMTIDQRGVARMTMHRPEKCNAFDEAMIGKICDVMGRLNADPNVRVIVITGAGKAFSAGADINMMRRAAISSAEENKDDARRLGHMLRAIYDSPKPTIALVNGPVIGAGVGITATCDIVIASEEAFFALTATRFGLAPASIAPFVVRAIGVRQARRLFLTGERVDAEKARELGLAHMVTMPAQLEATLDGVIGNLLLGGPEAQKLTKDLIEEVAFGKIDTSMMENTAALIAQIRASEECKEGLAAFLEKRKPGWVIESDD